MDAIDPLARHALRAPQWADSLRSTLRPTPSPAPTTRPAGSSESATTRSARPSKSARRVLSGDGIVAIAESRSRIWATIASLRAAFRRRLTHGDRPHHLHSVCGFGLSQLPAKLWNILLLRSGLWGILILTIQT